MVGPCGRRLHRRAYGRIDVFEPERSSLSPAMLAGCGHVARIPIRLRINLAAAGGSPMDDRLVCAGWFAPPAGPLRGPTEARAPHVHGKITTRRREP
jgi:hypothetical protein